MLTRLRRSAARLAGWYASPSGLVFLVGVAAAIVLTFAVGSAWGVLALAATVAVVVPAKLAHLEAARLDASRRIGRQAAAAKKVRRDVARLDKALPQVRSRSQAARVDAIGAIDAARHEWKDLLRAERRHTEAVVRRALDDRSAADAPIRSVPEDDSRPRAAGDGPAT